MRKNMIGIGAGSGNVSMFVPRPLSFGQILSLGYPGKDLPAEIRNWRKDNLQHLFRGLKDVVLSKLLNIPSRYGTLYLNKQTPNAPHHLLDELLGEFNDKFISGIPFPYFLQEKGFSVDNHFLGLAGFRVVTTTGVGFIVDAFQNLVELEDLKYHGVGTGSTAEAAGDTALVTELTTEYTGNVRATGTTTEGASANIYRTVGTNTMDEAPGAALREHGIFSQAATGGGVLLDRTVFAAITLASGDSLQSTYDHTQTAGS